MRLEGYAAVFNSWSTDLGGFREKILPGAFSRSLRSSGPVYAVHTHDWASLLGSTRSGSLKLFEDARGLAFELELPETALGRDVHELVRRGDLASMSFSFRVNGTRGEKWIETSSGDIQRTLIDVSVSEISTVARPAYAATSVQARSVTPRASVPETQPDQKVTQLFPEAGVQAARNRMTRRLLAARLTAA